ncbi:hypothetical protein SCOR_23910 [Sulfidibacter corallicola]|uniref:DUF885 domain-containing protein n=1 Tax=Sulfidibacter corallicola TaxID=2818388 RepID=A0A8A4TSR7_SULCO|nr:hypothetical protein [Sulfidibacter corallicola]QTD52543.1 hypothetical protein J3U87_08725 [Sulfidibacter corallicola]
MIEFGSTHGRHPALPAAKRLSIRGLASRALLITLTLTFLACGQGSGTKSEGDVAGATPSKGDGTMTQQQGAESGEDDISHRYVKLVLAMGPHDKNFVDAYYGPEAWREQALSLNLSPAQIRAEAETLRGEVRELSGKETDAILQSRYLSLEKQITAMIARVDLLAGLTFTFDKEAELLYDAHPPRHDEAHFKALVAQLEDLIPGEGDLPERMEAYRKQFEIPADKLDEVFQAAIRDARERTRKYIDLPESESFVVEYVNDKSWSGYNWYKGKYHSLIQVNTDFPITIDRAVDLACHEGYPGHHVFNVLLEKHMVDDKGWKEFTVYPLFSPQSLIAEGSANYGIQVAFPGAERVAYEREVLFPLAGLDPKEAERYYAIQDVLSQLKYAGNEAARAYLEGSMDADKAADWLVRYELKSPGRAKQRISFFDDYRAYVINYNYGEDLVAAYVEAKGGTADNPERRWQIFKELLSAPLVPSRLENN